MTTAAASSTRKYTRDPAIQVGDIHVEGDKTTLAPGESVRLWIDTPSDYDSWTQGSESGQELDDTLFGSWSNAGSGYSTVWTAPDRQGVYKPKLTVNDDINRGSTNGRNDLLVERTVTITVVRPSTPKIWDKGSALQGGTLQVSTTGGTSPGSANSATPTPGATPTPTTAPTASGAPTPTPRSIPVAPGATVTLTVDGASDSDHWTQDSTSGDEADELSYTWTGAQPSTAGTQSTSATLTAPESGSVTVSCDVDDKPTVIVAPDTGTRDDDKVTLRVRLVVDADGDGTGDEDEATPTPTPVTDPTATATPVGGTPTSTPSPTATPNPTATPAPCHISLTADGETWHSVNLSWNQCSDDDFSSYKLYRSTESGFSPDDSTYLGRGDDEFNRETIQYPDGGLTANTTYYYVLRTAHAGTTTDARAQVKTTELPTPAVKFEGLARACAGGIGVDSVHAFTITGTAKREDGTLVTDTDFKLSFEGNKGHDYSGDDPSLWPSANWTQNDIKKAKFVTSDANGNQTLVENLAIHTDKDTGQFSVTVLSSDIVSSDIKIKAKWTNSDGEDKDAGSQTCDFGKTESKRLFPHFSDPGEDNGWIIDFPDLDGPGSWTPAKVYLKFEKDTNGSDEPSNWPSANGHKVQIKIKEVQLRDGSIVSDPTAIQDYVILTNISPDQAQSGDTSFIMTTSGDGGAQVWLKAHDKINDAVSVTLEPTDLSRFDQ